MTRIASLALPALAGFVTWSIVCLAINFSFFAAAPTLFREDGSSPHVWVNAVLLGLSVCYSLLGGYACAWVAQSHHLRHAAALGVFQLGIGSAVQLQYWDVMPIWYHVLFLGLLIPGIVAGAALRLAAERRTPVAA